MTAHPFRRSPRGALARRAAGAALGWLLAAQGAAAQAPVARPAALASLPARGGFAGAGGTVAAESRIHEYAFLTPGAGPSVVAAGAGGEVWIAMARAGRLARFQDGQLREFPLPAGSFPVGLVADPQGIVWYSDIRRNVIARFDPRTGDRRDFPVPTADAWPFFLVRAPDGSFWFTERVGNKIGRLDPATGAITEYDVPTPHAQPAGMAVTPDGQIFFSENSANQIGHFDPRVGRVREYKIPSPATPGPHYGPAGIASDAEGNVWFAELDGRLGRIPRGTTRIEEVVVPDRATRPAGVAVDRFGVVWFTELDGNSVSAYNPALGSFRRHRLPTGEPDPRPLGPPEATARGEMPTSGGPRARTSRPFGIAVDSRGAVWFTEQYAHKVGTITPAEVDVVAPAGEIRAATAPVRVHLRTGTPAAATRYLLDGRPTQVDGELPLWTLAPGCHVLTARVPAGGGRTLEASSAFTVAPSAPLVRRGLAELARSTAISPTLRRGLAAVAARAEAAYGAGDTQAARVALRDAERLLAGVTLPAAAALAEHLRAFDLLAEREYPVETAALPATLVVEVGDAVAWRNTGAAPAALRSADGTLRSPDIKPGGSWSHTFHREGRFAYTVGGRAAAVEVRTRTTAMREIPMLGPDRVPGVLTFDPQGNLWFTAGGGGFSKLANVPLGNRIGRMSPDGKITEYETPTPESAPTSIKVADDGFVWFTERSGNHLGRLDPATGTIREFPLPTPMSGATGIALDARGGVWFTAKKASKIGRLDPATGRVTEFATPDSASLPSTISVDHHGFVWYDERGADKFLRLDPETGRTTEFRVPTAGSRVVGLHPDPRGYLWFLELGAHKIGRLDVSSGQIVEYAIPTPLATPFKAALDSYGRLWFTEVFGNKIGVLDDGVFREFAVPTAESMPGGIAIDARGSVWFSEQAGNRLGVIPGAARYLSTGRTPEAPAGARCAVPAGRLLPAGHPLPSAG